MSGVGVLLKAFSAKTLHRKKFLTCQQPRNLKWPNENGRKKAESQRSARICEQIGNPPIRHADATVKLKASSDVGIRLRVAGSALQVPHYTVAAADKAITRLCRSPLQAPLHEVAISASPDCGGQGQAEFETFLKQF